MEESVSRYKSNRNSPGCILPFKFMHLCCAADVNRSPCSKHGLCRPMTAGSVLTRPNEPHPEMVNAHIIE